MVTLAFPSLSPCSILHGRGTNTSTGAKTLSISPYTLKMVSHLPKLGKVCASRSSSSSSSDKEGHISSSSDNVKEVNQNLNEEDMPKHVAIILDGNRRWALERGSPVMFGHAAGKMAIMALIPICIKYGIKALTLFAFSTENWSRSKEEVETLMDLFTDFTSSDLENLMKLNIRASMIGERSTLPKTLQNVITMVEDISKINTGMEIKIAINYSGKYDIIEACKSVAAKVKDGSIAENDEINEKMMEQELVTKFGEYPCPDLLIRTSGECRLSNFMLWQLAYTELYFTDVLFPDFGEDDFVQALIAYQKNHRRYKG